MTLSRVRAGRAPLPRGPLGRGGGFTLPRAGRPVPGTGNMANKDRNIWYGRLRRWPPYIILAAVLIAVLMWIPASPA